MGAYLIDHPPKTRQFRDRTDRPSGVVVVHTAESTPDWVDHDSGAENVASFIANRTDYGSYHSLSDSDSIVPLVPWSMCAYHDGTGSNDHSVGISAATQAAKWMAAPERWRIATVINMATAAADYAKWLKRQRGIDIPARRISRAQSEAKTPGFISHAERDPSRRTDPGAEFPWDFFLDSYDKIMRGETPGGDWFDMATLAELKQAVREATGNAAIVVDPDAKPEPTTWSLERVLRELLNDEERLRTAVQNNADRVKEQVLAGLPADQESGLTRAQVVSAVEQGVESVLRQGLGPRPTA